MKTPFFIRLILRSKFLFNIFSQLLQKRDVLRSSIFVKNSKPKILSAEGYVSDVSKYNLSVTKKRLQTSRRAEILYKLLSLYDIFHPNNAKYPPNYIRLDDRKVLLVGPRNIHELFMAWTYGYKWENIVGIDLFSFNPKILVMDMNKLTFQNNYFDDISCAGTLSYSEDLFFTLDGFLKIIKRSGRIAFQHTYIPNLESYEWKGNSISPIEIDKYIEKNSCKILFKRDYYKKNVLDQNQVTVDYLIQKV